MKDYYQILGIEKHASKIEIKRAFRLYATKFHPDKQNGDEFFEDRFKEIREAYETLIDDSKRRYYDLNYQNNTSNDNSSGQFSREYNLKQKEVELKKKESDLLKKEQDLHYEDLLKEKSNRIKKTRELGNKLYYKSKKINITGLYISINTDRYLFENYFHAKSNRYVNYGLNITRFTLFGLASWCLIFSLIASFLPSVVYIGSILFILGLLFVIFAFFKKTFIIIYKGFRLFVCPKSILIMEGKENEIEIFEGYRFRIKKVEKQVNMAMNSYYAT